VFGIFNSLGGGEVIVILVLALIVLGPEKLPEAIRKFGNIYGELRRMSQGFQSELRDAFDEPMRELRGTAQAVQDAVQQPMNAVTSTLQGTSIDALPEPVAEVAPPAVENEAPAEEAQASVGDVDDETPAPVDDLTEVEGDDADGREAGDADDGPVTLPTAGDVMG
jgi:sec-independent protein translocase protein TatB